jgi:hypothetical protein
MLEAAAPESAAIDRANSPGGGSTTASITWLTPLLAAMLVFTRALPRSPCFRRSDGLHEHSLQKPTGNCSNAAAPSAGI